MTSGTLHVEHMRTEMAKIFQEVDRLGGTRAGMEGEGHLSAYTSVERREAADIDAVGKYEPKLTENGIPADVLAKLLPGDDVIELEMPVVGGNLAYRFVKRAFDVVSCSCALIILAIPMGVIALKIKSESPGPVVFA